jgi:hypothetical protein
MHTIFVGIELPLVAQGRIYRGLHPSTAGAQWKYGEGEREEEVED